MYLDFLVEIPEVKGKITKKKKGDTVYVNYEIGRTYNLERKYNVPERDREGFKIGSNEDGSQRMLPYVLSGG